MKKIPKNQSQKFTADDIKEVLKSLLNELEFLDDHDVELITLFQMQNTLFNKMKNVSDKHKMQVDHIELFRIHIMNKHNKN